jgi:nitroreductase
MQSRSVESPVPRPRPAAPRRPQGGLRVRPVRAALALALALLLPVLAVSCSSSRPPAPQGGPARPLAPPAFSDSSTLRVLQKRQTSRAFAPEPLGPQLTADLLWAANGVNRPATGQRTAPTAHDWRYIDVYVFEAGAVSVYDPARHALLPVLDRDLRRLTGLQDFAATAPLSLVYVADERRLEKVDDETRALFEAASAGAMVQNVYLLGAERGLAVGVRADIDRRALHEALGLAPQQRILLAQSVGRPSDRNEPAGHAEDHAQPAR